jgi:hypothetical protein
MKTAVDEVLKWVKDELQLFGSAKQILIDKLNQAKEMEKEQIVNAFEIGYDNGACVQEGNAIYHGSNYYNETYKSE